MRKKTKQFLKFSVNKLEKKKFHFAKQFNLLIAIGDGDISDAAAYGKIKKRIMLRDDEKIRRFCVQQF